MPWSMWHLYLVNSKTLCPTIYNDFPKMNLLENQMGIDYTFLSCCPQMP